IAAYPELGNEPGTPVEVRTAWGISSRILNVAESTVTFVTDVLDELVDVFPFGYVHLGGDEVPPDEWLASPAARDRAAAAGLSTVEGLLGWWARRLAGQLAGHGRRAAVGWTDPQPRDFAQCGGRLAAHLARLDVLKVNYRPLDGPDPLSGA